MARPKRSDYITDGYIEDINHYIYNDLPLSDLYDKENNTKYFIKEFEELLVKGEKYVRLKHHLEHIAVTSKCRVFNLVRPRWLVLKFSNTTTVMYISGEKIDLEQVFIEQGWEYDVDKLHKEYVKRNWKRQDPLTYKDRPYR